MDPSQIREVVLQELTAIAPEVDVQALVPGESLRTQVDLDSYDWLNFLIALHQRLKVEIPEPDYAHLATVNDLVNYLSRKLP